MRIHFWSDNRISPFELAGMSIALILATGSITLPVLTAMLVEHDAWLSASIGSIAGIAVVFIVHGFSRRFPDGSFPDWCENVTGPAVARAIFGLYILYFLFVSSGIVRESTDFLIIGFYRGGPPFALGVLLVALTTYMAWHGLESIGRTTLIVLPVQFFFTTMVTVSATAQYQPELILPLFEEGVLSVVRAAVVPATWFGELLIIAFFYSSVKGKRERFVAALSGAVIVTIAIVAITVSSTLLFGDQTGRFAYPRASTARFVALGGFLRIDPLAMAIWLFLTAVKVGLFQLVTATLVGRLFNLRDHRPVLIPLAALQLVLSQGLFESKQELDAWLMSGAPVYAATMQLLFPAALLLLAVATGRRGEDRTGSGRTGGVRRKGGAT